MQHRKLHLKNFCQHADLTVDFPEDETIFILGGNGRGKSNLVKGLRFACIGESANPGKKADDLNWQAAAAGEGGFVELEFVVGGQAGRIKRAINQTRTQLHFGEEKITSSNAATNRLLELSGVSRKVLEEIVFVMQGSLEEILFDSPADRVKKLQGLFGIANVEKLREVLHREMALITTDPVDDRIKELQKQLDTDIDPQLRNLNHSKAMYEEDLNVDLDRIKRVYAAWDRYAKDILTASAIESKKLMLETEREIAVRSATSDDEIKQIQARISEMAHEVANAKASLQSIEHARAAEKAYKRLKAELAEISVVLGEPEPTPPPVTAAKLAESRQQVTLANDAIDRAKRFMALYKNNEGGTCELCGQPLVFTAQKVGEMERLLDKRPQIVREVSAAIATGEKMLSDYEEARVRYASRRADALNRWSKVSVALSDTPELEVPDIDEASMTRMVLEHETLVDKYNTVTARNNEQREIVARCDGKIATMEQQLAELVTSPPCSEAEADYAERAIEAAEKARLKLAEIEGQLRQLHALRTRTLAEMEGLKKQASSAEAKRTYKQLCTDARDVLHRDVLPQVVMRQYLTALNTELNKYLQIFNVPFSCTVNDDLTVTCTIDGFADKPAERLSGGQRVMLGIAFRFAICNLFASTLGFVVLDEPTVWLDEENVAVVADMFRSVRQHALSSGLQLIVITHEAQLASVDDCIIEV